MIKFKKWLKTNEISQREAAHVIPCSPAKLCRVLAGKTKNPGIKFILGVKKLTKGAIKPEDWT